MNPDFTNTISDINNLIFKRFDPEKNDENIKIGLFLLHDHYRHFDDHYRHFDDSYLHYQKMQIFIDTH